MNTLVLFFLLTNECLAVLPDLAICSHLGYFLTQLATNILLRQIENFPTFWALFQKMSKTWSLHDFQSSDVDISDFWKAFDVGLMII